MDESDNAADGAPEIPIRPQPATDWTGPFPLPDCLVRFYAAGGPDDFEFDVDWTSYRIPSLANLWAFQECYRYASGSADPVVGWDPDHLVLASRNADAWVLSMSKGRVAFFEHDTDIPISFENEESDQLDGLLPDLSERMAEDLERARESRHEEIIVGIKHVNFADVSAACKGLPIPGALKLAWVHVGYGGFGEGPRGPLRVLSPMEVRDIHAVDPAAFEGGVPLCRDPEGVFARVDKSGKVVLFDGRRRGTAGEWLERLAEGRGP